MQGVAGSSPVSPRNENTFFHWLEECVFFYFWRGKCALDFVEKGSAGAKSFSQVGEK